MRPKSEIYTSQARQRASPPLSYAESPPPPPELVTQIICWIRSTRDPNLVPRAFPLTRLQEIRHRFVTVNFLSLTYVTCLFISFILLIKLFLGTVSYKEGTVTTTSHDRNSKQYTRSLDHYELSYCNTAAIEPLFFKCVWNLSRRFWTKGSLNRVTVQPIKKPVKAIRKLSTLQLAVPCG